MDKIFNSKIINLIFVISLLFIGKIAIASYGIAEDDVVTKMVFNLYNKIRNGGIESLIIFASLVLIITIFFGKLTWGITLALIAGILVVYYAEFIFKFLNINFF
jgi:type IV secretory pathway VirB2 component (pilin)